MSNNLLYYKYKDNTKIYIIQYIYKYMRKRLLIENDISELDDFQKILLLNKRKLSPDDVGFKSDKDDLKLDHVQVKHDGLLFDFDDLEAFLKFFHYESFELGTDGEWDAVNYDRMYHGSYDWEYECADRSDDDWSEGYVLGYFCNQSSLKLKELLKIIAPSLVDSISDDGKRIDDESEITDVLDKFFSSLGDEANDIICSSRANATDEGAKQGIINAYCETLSEFGIEKWGEWCFGLYFISWGNLVQLFIEDGEFDKNALDVIIDKINRKFRHTLPDSYEMESYFMDNDIFNSESCQKLEDLIDVYIEKAEEDLNPDYIAVMEKITKLGLFSNRGLEIPGQKGLRIKVQEVDPETLKVKYIVGSNSYFGDRQYGLSTVDSVIAMATQPGLFNSADFRIQPGQLKR
jgi:hypothetical protein